MTLLSRLGLAIVRPRSAFAIAGDRTHPGRSGSDLLVALVAVVLATQLRALVTAVWLGSVVEPSLGLRAAVQVLTDAIVVDLGFLVLGAAAIWLASGPRRELGRAFDLACVAVLPLLVIDVAGSLVVYIGGWAGELVLSRTAMWAVSGVAYAWTGALIALAAVNARRVPAAPGAGAPARRAGVGLALMAVAGIAVQTLWLIRHSEQVRPMQSGDPAPAIALPRIGPGGALGERVMLAPGKVTVLDFWATWCGPCLKSMPQLDALARRHPDVVVLAISLDEDLADPRALFDERHYAMTLLAGDRMTANRYGVGPIPHTVLIDRDGNVRHVFRGGNAAARAEAELEALLK